MLQKQGWSSGKGLGRAEQGMLDIRGTYLLHVFNGNHLLHNCMFFKIILIDYVFNVILWYFKL